MTKPTMDDLIRAASEHSDVAVDDLEDRVRNLERQVGAPRVSLDAPPTDVLPADRFNSLEHRVSRMERSWLAELLLIVLWISFLFHACNNNIHNSSHVGSSPAVERTP